MNELVLILLAAIVEGLLHYIPWRKFLKGNELPRLAAYIFGVLGLMVPFTYWLMVEQGELFVAVTLWKVIVGGGMTVIALYGLDHYVDLIWKDMEATEREVHAKK